MFGIDFPEFVVIAVVALIVLGPERLPKAARFAGLWVRRARAQWASVKNELERELAAEELKRSMRDTETAMRDLDARVRSVDAGARKEFDEIRSAASIDTARGDATSPEDTPAAVTPTDHRDPPADSLDTPLPESKDDVRHA
ncbi:Sec-independent protein translocase protein TatB [Luteimonas panaciterrae]|uniref:Sec-independent protein translocase protein TatB n=1 Tax=Luteimonas panaciterrae TaxID=363885 RepID=UPI001CFB8F9F|nr:Sec-independent protein translocase protein TatB [Luteimonas panaciterrae]